MTDSSTTQENERLRSIASDRLVEIMTEAKMANDAKNDISSWLDGSTLSDTTVRCRCLHQMGFVKVENFCSDSEYHDQKDEMSRLVRDCWHPEAEAVDSFGTNQAQNTQRGDYFLESADKIHFFSEPEALGDDSKLLSKYHGENEKIKALNKVGHGLHLGTEGAFATYAHSEKLRKLVVDELRWTDPVIPQSMYIFKQARTGGAVNSHQDSTFLYTQPRQSCLGLWLALDDATLDNGCLWLRPKSHLEPVRRQYKRNPEYFQRIDDDSSSASTAAKFIMETLEEGPDVPWDGMLPDDLLKAGFVPVECKAGDLLVFCGQLDHLSLPNTSEKPRHTFQLHLVSGKEQWSPHNWLQYPPGKAFVAL